MAAKFVIEKGSSGKYRFNLKAGNGEIILSSETYESKQILAKYATSTARQNPASGRRWRSAPPS
jgi:uncharacterized protein YegP (UPF0339 family)